MTNLNKLWDDKAEEWNKWINPHRIPPVRQASDYLLDLHLQKIKGLKIIDAGCGNGYLSIKLARKGAIVTAVDLSSKMLEKAKGHCKEENIYFDIIRDDCQSLEKIEDATFDIAISSFVLLDMPDLFAGVKTLYRVLKPGGVAHVLIAHPMMTITVNYFSCKLITKNWNTEYFSTPFQYYHRPITQYWRAYKAAGFNIIEMIEPEGILSTELKPRSLFWKLQKPA